MEFFTTILVLAIPAGYFVHVTRIAGSRRDVERAIEVTLACTICGYNLVGLDKNPKCPECGQPNADLKRIKQVAYTSEPVRFVPYIVGVAAAVALAAACMFLWKWFYAIGYPGRDFSSNFVRRAHAPGGGLWVAYYTLPVFSCFWHVCVVTSSLRRAIRYAWSFAAAIPVGGVLGLWRCWREGDVAWSPASVTIGAVLGLGVAATVVASWNAIEALAEKQSAAQP